MVNILGINQVFTMGYKKPNLKVSLSIVKLFKKDLNLESMKLQNQKNKGLDLGTILVSLAFLFTYLLGSIACSTKYTSNRSITESHVKYPNKEQKINDSIKFIWVNPNLLYKDIPIEKLYGTKYFDETQYASDHWDEYLEDPENIDDFPENIFDAQQD